jgi:type II secretory ATPase GspE/PulE/Tfp pilus assembly ATPase PilB-like protein
MGISKDDVLTQQGNVNALVYQKRFPCLCFDCRIPLNDYQSPKKEGLVSRLSLLQTSLEGVFVRNLSGCDACRHRGVKGSRVAMEVVRPSEVMSESVRLRDKKEFYRSWVKRCQANNWGDVAETHLYHSLRLSLKGDVCPLVVEESYGDIDETLLMEETNTWRKEGGFHIEK